MLVVMLSLKQARPINYIQNKVAKIVAAAKLRDKGPFKYHIMPLWRRGESKSVILRLYGRREIGDIIM